MESNQCCIYFQENYSIAKEKILFAKLDLSIEKKLCAFCKQK